MYSNSFYECSVGPLNEKRQKTLFIVVRILKIISIIIFVCMMIFCFMFGSWKNLLFYGIATIIPVVCLFFLQRYFYNFYDYIFVDGSIRIIKVTNNIKRKAVLIFDYKNIIKVGLTSGECKIDTNSNKIKKIYCTPNKLTDDDIYLYVTTNGKSYLLLLQY